MPGSRPVEPRRDPDIERAENEYRMLFENSISGIYRLDPAGRMLRANRALARMNGYETGEAFIAAVNASPPDWFVEPAQGEEIMRRLLAEGRVTDFLAEVFRHRTRERYWMTLTAWTIRDAAGEVVAMEGVATEATERKRTEDRIARMARQDAVTRLPNRHAFTERLEAALAVRGAAVAVLLLDVDRLKTVNDTLGHPAGDALLRALAERIAGLLDPGDEVARFGGDEFALLLHGAGPPDAAACAQRLLAALRAPVTLGRREIVASASIGIAIAPDDGVDPTVLLRAADVALYSAKGAGRDAWRRFDPAMDAAQVDRERLVVDLRAALDGGGFSLSFQPVVCLTRERPVGFEALLRWTHATRGAVAPEAFIPVAEETGLIVPIGAWALARACASAAAWDDETSLWVNVSPVELAEPGYEAALAAALTASGLAPARLVLEITETALIGDGAELAPRLGRLRGLGVRIALDDFGAGYSSLSHLRRFPFDVLKLDRSFTAALAEPVTAAIVSSVLELGRRLGLATVAEGVETEAQLETLRRMGCAYVQGRHVGPPVEAVAR